MDSNTKDQVERELVLQRFEGATGDNDDFSATDGTSLNVFDYSTWDRDRKEDHQMLKETFEFFSGHPVISNSHDIPELINKEKAIKFVSRITKNGFFRDKKLSSSDIKSIFRDTLLSKHGKKHNCVRFNILLLSYSIVA